MRYKPRLSVWKFCRLCRYLPVKVLATLIGSATTRHTSLFEVLLALERATAPLLRSMRGSWVLRLGMGSSLAPIDCKPFWDKYQGLTSQSGGSTSLPRIWGTKQQRRGCPGQSSAIRKGMLADARSLRLRPPAHGEAAPTIRKPVSV